MGSWTETDLENLGVEMSLKVQTANQLIYKSRVVFKTNARNVFITGNETIPSVAR